MKPYNSVREVRFFQRRPHLPTIEGSVAISEAPELDDHQKNNIMFAIKYPDGSYLSEDNQRTTDVRQIQWISYWMKAEERKGSGTPVTVKVVLDEVMQEMDRLREEVGQLDKGADPGFVPSYPGPDPDGPRAYTHTAKPDEENPT